MKKYRGYIIRREDILVGGKTVREWRAYFNFPTEYPMLASCSTLRELKEDIDEYLNTIGL